MENFISNNTIQFGELISYFSCELFYLIGIVLNILLFYFFKKKCNVKRLSGFLTSVIFLINSFILFGIYLTKYISFGGFNFILLDGSLQINSFNVLICLLINVFMFLFMITTYKVTKKIHYKVPIINSNLLTIAMISSVLVYTDNFIVIYLLIEAITFFIYNYASSMRIRKYSVFSKDYIMLGLIASILFLAFYFSTFLTAKNNIQLDILRVCMTLAFLLKIGLFPVYNYQITREYKTNIPYSILLFSYLPFIGIVAFNKMTEYMSVSIEVYQIPLLLFMCICLISFALFAARQKNIIKFCANLSYFICAFCIMYIIYFPHEGFKAISFAAGETLVILAFYFSAVVLRINTEVEKINTASYKGLSFNNRMFSFVTTFLLLIIAFIIPSYNFELALDMIKDIYSYDKTSVITVATVLFAQIAILFKVFKIIENIYGSKRENIKEKLEKGAAYMYLTPVCVILFLIIKLFL